MSSLAKHRTLFSLAAALVILIIATAAIFWARGFKPNFKDGKIERTGLLVISSTPTGARVYLDDRLTSATDTNIAFLEPKTYKLRLEKDGYTTWGKEIEIKADLATEIKALLFPQAPEIKPLTTTGASNPSLSPDNSKIAYGAPGERGGLYLMPLSDSPLSFRQNPRLLAKNQLGFDFSKSSFIWGPDSKQLIARFEEEGGKAIANLLVDAEKSQQEIRDITGSLGATLAAWQEELDLRARTQALLAPESVTSATAAAELSQSQSQKSKDQSTPNSSLSTLTVNYFPTGLIFSPDEEKILYSPRPPRLSPRFGEAGGEAGVEAGKNKEVKYKVYDLKLKKETSLPDLPDLVNISWFPTSNHLVIAQNNLISIIEVDGTNKMTVFSGKFENGFVFAHPSGTRLIILTTLTQTEGTPANLYAINLK